MRKTYLLAASLAGLLLLALTTAAYADDGAAKQAVTITGQATCAKCALHLTDECQTVIQTQSGGQTVTYYLTDNDLAKSFHKNICKAPGKATATGTVEEKDGKKELTVTKIDLVK